MFRRSDKSEETTGEEPDYPTEQSPDELDALGAPVVWTVKSALAWCRRHNWHINGIEKGAAVWDAGNVYMGRIVSPITPDVCVETPATFDRAAQTGEWVLVVHNIKGQRVFVMESKP